jgi:hypothetical protein
MNLEALALYFQANDCGIPGVTLFANEMPDTCNDGTLLMGSYSGDRIDHNMPGWFVTEFRIVVRATDFVTGKTLAAKVCKVATTHAGFTAGNMLVRQCLPVNTPRSYRRSAGGYWEFEADVEIVFVDTTP